MGADTNASRVIHRDDLSAALAATFGSKPSFWWVRQLTRHKVPHSLFWNFEVMKHHPMVLENQDIVRIDTERAGVIYVGGPTAQFSETPVTIARGAFPGEHTREILGSLPAERPRPVDPPEQQVRVGGPLDGLHVLELSEGISGPYRAQLLGDGGGDVVKVEKPAGDHTRRWGPSFKGGESAVFLALNRNKRSVVLDAGDADARSRLEDLARWADVIVADHIDADGQQATMSYEEAAALNPAAVYCSISPFGEKGPFVGLPGSELVFQAQSNIWAGLGRSAKRPLVWAPTRPR